MSLHNAGSSEQGHSQGVAQSSDAHSAYYGQGTTGGSTLAHSEQGQQVDDSSALGHRASSKEHYPDHHVSEDVLSELATASRILAHKGVVDAYGHVSCRHPRFPETHFLLSRNLAPGLVLNSDIVVYRIADAEPEMGEDKAPRGFLERFIHAEIYKRYKPEDVSAVVHCHTAELLPFTLTKRLPFKAATHMSAFLGSVPAPIFDLVDVVGPNNDMLIRNSVMGAALADKFTPHQPHLPVHEEKKKGGLFSSSKKHAPEPAPYVKPRSLVLMRGHGATIVGRSLQVATYRAVYAKANAQTIITLHSLLGGITGLAEDHSEHQGVTMLSESEAVMADSIGQVGRAWDMWSQEAMSGQRF